MRRSSDPIDKKEDKEMDVRTIDFAGTYDGRATWEEADPDAR
jgi:hypothetical protein